MHGPMQEQIKRAASLDGNTLLFRLKRQRTLVLSIAIVLFAALAVSTQFLTPIYRASATLMVEGRTPRPPVRGSEAESDLPTPYAADVIGTEMAVIGSREIMSQVAERLHLITTQTSIPLFNLACLPTCDMRL